MTSAALRKGQNRPLTDGTGEPCSRVQVILRWSDPDSTADVDISALLLGPDGKVRSDEDLVFYNSPVGADGAVRLVGKTESEDGSEDRVAIDVEALPASIHQVAIAASLQHDDGLGFGSLGGLSLTVLNHAGEELFGYDITDASTETAFVFGELYLRADQWKFRAVGQGWEAGLAGLATDYGISVDASDAGAEVETGTVLRSAVTGPEDEAVHAEAGSGGPTVDPIEDLSFGDTTATSATDGASQDLVVEDGTAPAEIASMAAPSGDPEVDSDEVSADFAAVVEEVPAAVVPTATPVRRNASGVRTQKPKPKPAAPPPLTLGGPNWHAARLFSIYGVGAQEEQEKRATSALLASAMAVKEFGRTLISRLGGPAGTIECYQEVSFKLGDRTVVPDGVIVAAGRGGRVWTALLETKTGANALRPDQVEAYVDVAVSRGFDAVVTLSNEIAIIGGDHPAAVDRKRLKKVALHHLSWAEVLHEARMQAVHRGVEDRHQSWILHELIRYLEHPKSGAATFDDMGPAWVPVREAVRTGTLRAANAKIGDVVRSWDRLTQHLAMRLTSDLGVPAWVVVSRALSADAPARQKDAVATVLRDGTLQAHLRIQRAAGVLHVVADLKANKVHVSVDLDAPREGGASRRVNWLLRQLKTAPDDVFVEVLCAKKDQAAAEHLKNLRDDNAALVPDSAADVRSFRLKKSFPMGQKRNGLQGGFVTSVNAAVDRFYYDVVQGIKPWVKPAARLPADVAEEAAETIEGLDRAAAEIADSGSTV
ncbi:TerD family protein [Nakamurella deserti]|uniref:TerD family protein n=1 Tax=Nakamurella deserti TaxID=2164074 RepID=UPI000DBE8B3C|nr:TerD family protein [Nakamurella deserti]